MALHVIDSVDDLGKRRFKVVSPGRTGFVWKAENEVPTIVVKTFDLSQEDKVRLGTTEGTDGD
jgi:hypothetical protein